MFKMLSCCMNWKVIVGLGAAGLGVWILAPNLIAGLLPTLVLLICPLSMLLMMPMMMMGQKSGPSSPGLTQPVNQLPVSNLSREEQLAELKAQMSNLQVQQQATLREISSLEQSKAPVLREAEAVLLAAGEQRTPRN